MPMHLGQFVDWRLNDVQLADKSSFIYVAVGDCIAVKYGHNDVSTLIFDLWFDHASGGIS